MMNRTRYLASHLGTLLLAILDWVADQEAHADDLAAIADDESSRHWADYLGPTDRHVNPAFWE